MDISVIVPAYNSSKTIINCLRSIFDQTYPCKEVILIDDGSSDNTVSIVSSIFPMVQIYSQKNSGPSVARNLGILNSTYEWVAFLDSDDVWECSILENYYKIHLKNKDLKWIATSYLMSFNDSKTKSIIYSGKYYKDDRIFNLFLAYSDFRHRVYAELITTCSVIINKNFFSKSFFFDEKFKNGEDIDLWFRLSLISNEIGYCRIPGFKYSRNVDTSITSFHARNFDKKQNNLLRISNSWNILNHSNKTIKIQASYVLNIWIYRELKSIIKSLNFSLISIILKSNYYKYLSLKNRIIICFVSFLLFSILLKNFI